MFTDTTAAAAAAVVVVVIVVVAAATAVVVLVMVMFGEVGDVTIPGQWGDQKSLKDWVYQRLNAFL